MESRSQYVFDLECNGFNPDRIWCVSAGELGKKIRTTSNYDNMRKFFSNANNILIGHNIIRFDVIILEKLLGITCKAKLVDTLALSWYLYPNRVLHGLEAWGEEFGIPKPPIVDWDTLSVEDYKHRCEEDVKINTMLWKKQWSYLKRLYGSEEEAWRCVDYLTWKMDCAKEQERLKWKLDIGKCMEAFQRLSDLKKVKVVELQAAMPKVPVVKTASYPAKPFKKDGSISSAGLKWQVLRESHGVDDDCTEFSYVDSYKEPNPNSNVQIKSWLVGLDWIPQTFKYKRDKETNEITTIPQINMEHGAGICPSIKALYHKEPSLSVLDGLAVLSHRISILKGFLNAVDKDGYVQAQIQGLTNTIRFKHKVVVNLPSVGKPYGSDIRGCLVAPDGYELVGSDMSSLEDRTGMHYMYNLDPEYVAMKSTDDFDPHLKIAVAAGLMTEAEEEFFKWYKEKG